MVGFSYNPVVHDGHGQARTMKGRHLVVGRGHQGGSVGLGNLLVQLLPPFVVLVLFLFSFERLDNVITAFPRMEGGVGQICEEVVMIDAKVEVTVLFLLLGDKQLGGLRFTLRSAHGIKMTHLLTTHSGDVTTIPF